MNYYLVFIISLLVNNSFSQEKMNWTIMHYSVGSNSSELHLMSDIDEMKRGKLSNNYNLITLIDRIEGFSEDSLTLDGNFTDTRLYQIDANSYIRLEGMEFFPEMKSDQSYEINMADASNLKKFIQYCKKYYPAHHYMLVLRSHGNGVSMCSDAEGGTMDSLYPGEISTVLSRDESVNILGLDVCSMAGLENLYEWRPGGNSFSADFIIASAPISGAWAYDAILSRLTNKKNINSEAGSSHPNNRDYILNPATAKPIELSKLIFEEIYENQRWSSWGLFDNSKILDLKTKIDEASILLSFETKESIIDIVQNSLAYYHNTSDNLEIAQLTSPYVDAFHFWSQISENKEFSDQTRSLSREVCNAIDDLVVDSYYGQGYFPRTNNFTNRKSGVYQIIPLGDKIYSQTNRSFWSHCNWFHPDDKSGDENSFGQYDWCIKGATRANHRVDNFYELLDFLFDKSNDENGGVNKYRW